VGVFHGGIQGPVTSDLGYVIDAHSGLGRQGAKRVAQAVNMGDSLGYQCKALGGAILVSQFEVFFVESIYGQRVKVSTLLGYEEEVRWLVIRLTFCEVASQSLLHVEMGLALDADNSQAGVNTILLGNNEYLLGLPVDIGDLHFRGFGRAQGQVIYRAEQGVVASAALCERNT
jgi:hypothetical protein